MICCLCLASGLLTARAHGGDPTFDLQGLIDRELAAGNKRIVVPPGRYRVTPRNRQHLLLENRRDVEIVADNVELICTQTTRALTITNCVNVSVRGLTIDYDPLPFTQGRIAALSADRTVHDVELFEGYPEAAAARNFKYEIFRPDTRTLRTDDRYPSRLEVTGRRSLRIHAGKGGGEAEQVGDLVVIGTEFAPQGSIPHAVVVERGSAVRLEDLTLYASNCFGFIEYECESTTYLRCRIARRDPRDDPARRADPRLRSLNADAFHSKRATRGPAYVDCVAQFMGDDAININGEYHMVMKAAGRELRVLAKHDMNIRAGDPVEIVQYDGARLPDARVVAVVAGDGITNDERLFLSKQRLNDRLQSARGALNRGFTVTLDRAVALPQGSVICAANRMGNGISVKGCRFGFNRSRGILIKASDGVVSGNTIEGSRMAAILVSPEYWWLEAGSSSDVSITGNTIIACGGVGICVESTGGNASTSPAGAHQRIIISGNSIRDSLRPGILVTSTSDLRLENNSLDLRQGAARLPGHVRLKGLPEVPPIVEINTQRAGPN